MVSKWKKLVELYDSFNPNLLWDAPGVVLGLSEQIGALLATLPAR